MYPMILSDRGFAFGETDMDLFLRAILEAIDDRCEAAAIAFTDERPLVRKTVAIHLVQDHGVEDIDFLFMLDRYHIHEQIRNNEEPFGLLYKREP